MRERFFQTELGHRLEEREKERREEAKRVSVNLENKRQKTVSQMNKVAQGIKAGEIEA